MTAIYTAAALAVMLDCGVEQIELQARQGALPGLKFGRTWIFPEAALLEALNERATKEAAKRRGEIEEPAQAVDQPKLGVQKIGVAANSPRVSKTTRRQPPAIGYPPGYHASKMEAGG